MNGCIAYPAEYAEQYRTLGYWKGQNLTEFLSQTCQTFPEHIAIIDDQYQLTYADFQQWIERTATALAPYFKVGDKAVLQLPNRAEFYVLFFALIRLGVVPIMALAAHRYNEIQGFVGQTQAKAYFATDFGAQKFDYRSLADRVQAAQPSLEHVFILGEAGQYHDLAQLMQNTQIHSQYFATTAADEVVFLQLSGGSTGTPKLIPRTHDDYLYSVRESAKICGLDDSSRLLMVLPAAHNFSMSSAGALGIFYAGGTVVLGQDPSPDAAFALIKEHGVTDVCLVPALVRPWMDKAAKEQDLILAQLRCLQVGGARLPNAVAERLITQFQVKLQQVFGMAEGLVNYTRFEMSAEQIINTQGTKISEHDEILVLNDEDHPVAAGEVGHLLTRGPYTIRGYYNAPEHNQSAFTPDGFYRTGDLVRIREDGCIVVEGRAKEQINRGGEKIATEEVEQILVKHPQVRLVALVAMPDEVLGEKSCAFIAWQAQEGDANALRKGMQLRQYLKDYGLATYKIPDRIEFLDHFPYTAFGKIDKKALRTMLNPVPA